MEQALYLKYRPKNFSDLDVKPIREYFEKLIESGKVPHAFLFTGPKGIGKTSAARIAARLVNCEKNQKEKLSEPCGECGSCLSIINGSAVDVIEIDAASNRGIDDVRELREKVNLAPISLTHKVFIIDECHMLTTEASNALLKTLEEPPANTIFILCTTEAHKVIPTIASRCTVVHFRKATPDELIQRLEKVVKGEKIDISQKGLEMIAKAAGGSFRDGVKILEQLLSGGVKIDDEKVAEAVGQHSATDPEGIIEPLIRRNLDESLEQVKKIEESGASVRVVIERAIENLRERILTQEEKVGLVALVRMFDQAGRELKDASIPVLPLELLAVEWCADKNKKTREMKVEEVAEDEKVEDEKKDEKRKTLSGKEITFEEIERGWKDLMKAIRPKNHSVEAFLRSTKPLTVDGDRLILEVFYKFHKERLESERSRVVVEESMLEVYGAPLKLVFKLGDGRPKREASKVENISGEVADDVVKAAEEIFGVQAI